MGKRLAILQSNYIPWKGYFDLMNSVDEFILYDDMQYTKNDWRNRNKIKTGQGAQWLTIPIKQANLTQTIRETEVAADIWRAKHWKTLAQVYSKSPHFNEVKLLLEPLYMASSETMLSTINFSFIKAINGFLGIETRLRWSSEFDLSGDRNGRLVNLCKATASDTYLTGPSALDYMDQGLFAAAGIVVEVADYAGYPEYPQFHPPFDHAVSIVDLLFNAGREAKSFMKSFPSSKSPMSFALPLAEWRLHRSGGSI